jgi:hypothetical protein
VRGNYAKFKPIHKERETMPNYILFLHENPMDFQDMSADEMQAIIQKYSAWRQQMAQAGKLTGGKKLTEGAGRVLSRVNGQPSISDGPYTESKEVIGGLFEIIASNYDEAVEIALQCPHLAFGKVEVREIEIT